MPPKPVEKKVQEPEYKNWLKVHLALHNLTVGLRSFTALGVNSMHKSILKKLYGCSTVPGQCSSCKSDGVKQNRNTDIWEFQSRCPSKLCDAWLTELMINHVDPKSPKIYWENCDVTSWPFVPWECAKLYMPRGQPRSNTGPAKSDSQALLTLMYNCTYFHTKLSKMGLRLTHMVSGIRNKASHNEELRFSDADRKRFIEDMICLLEDPIFLRSREDCKDAVKEIRKINDIPIHVSFTEDEERLALKTALAGLRHDLGVHEERTSDTVDSMKKEYKQLIQQLREELEAVQDRQDNVEKRMDTVEEGVNTVKKRVDTVEKGVVSVNKRVDTNERGLHTALLKQEKKQQEMHTAVTSHGVRLDTVGEHVEHIYTRQDSIQRDVQSVKQKTDQHEKDIQEIKASPSQGTTEVSAEKMESDIKKLRDDLIEGYRTLRCVQVSPEFEKKRCNIDHIYVDLFIEKQDMTSTQREIRSTNKKINEVTQFKQIFFNETGAKFKRVFVRGKGGLGKTTFCRKVLDAWCRAHERNVGAQNGPFQDEDALESFHLLFFLNLREISDEVSLFELIFAQLPFVKDHGENLLETFLKGEGDKVLFILDGLDEMTVKAGFIEKVVTRRAYLNCCFLVSSRPWKMYELELHDEFEIDLLVDIKGFSWDNAMTFVNNIFNSCYRDRNAIKQFKKDVEENKIATQLIHVPLLLLFIAHLWYDENKRSLPSKLHELYLRFLNLMVGRREEKYKKDHDQMKFTLVNAQSQLPRKISEISLVVNFGEGFLLSLCEVAHHFLLTSQQENSLVFEEANLLNALGDRGKEKLNIALDLGVLSVSDSVSYLNRKTNVSFLHKTVQEFFTAVYFIFNPDKLTNFISSIADVNAVQQNENIIVFLVGLMPELGNRVLEKVNELYQVNWEMLSIGEEPEMYEDRLYGVSKLYLRCKEEVIGPGEDVLLNVSGLFLMQNRFDLCSWNPAFMRNLILEGDNKDYLDVDLKGLTGLTYLRLNDVNCELNLPESGSLLVLIMKKVTISSNCCQLLGHALTRNTRLNTLAIDDMNFHNGQLDLANMTELSALGLSRVILSSSCCNVLGTSLMHCTKLQTLLITFTDLHDCVLDLSNMTELKALGMLQVTLSSSCSEMLGSTLACCTKMEHLELHSTNLDSCLLDLSKMEKLVFLDMCQVQLSSHCCDELGKALKHCTELESLSIHGTDLHNCLLDLSNMTELTVIGKWPGVTQSTTDCFDNDRTLSHCTKLKKLSIHNRKMHNVLFDMFEMKDETELDVYTVTLTSCCWDVGRTLERCTKLERLSICNTDFLSCMLDFSNMTELTDLYMSDVTLSSSFCDVLGNTLTHCTKMKRLEIHNTDLHDCRLQLSNMKQLSEIELREIILSDTGCQVLEQSLLLENFSEYTFEKTPDSNDKWKIDMFDQDYTPPSYFL